MSLENLKRVFSQANAQDIAEGSQSYPRYKRIMEMMGAKHGFDHRIAAAVFCALSPNNDYLGNLRDASKLMRAKRASKTIDDFKVSTYGNNKRKAWAIVGGADPLELIKAPKTRSFFLNVCDPTDPIPVTVDGHIYNVWNGKRMKLTGLRVLGDYEEVAEGVRQLAREEGFVPCQMQGVLWMTWKRIHNILVDGQITFWCDDLIYADVGFHRALELQEVI